MMSDQQQMPSDQDQPSAPRKQATQMPTRVLDEIAEQARISFEAFLATFELDSRNCYLDQIRALSAKQKTTLYVDFAHLAAHNELLAYTLSETYFRLEPYLRKAIQNLVKEYDPTYLVVGESIGGAGIGESREFWISWYRFINQKVLYVLIPRYGLETTINLRQMKMAHHGHLVRIGGTVTRTSEVRPELLFGTFACGDCGAIIKDVEQEFKYTEPSACSVEECGNRINFKLITEQSKFADWQKVRIQENSSEVPSGAMPRSMDVIFRNEAVETAKAGDRVFITGTPLVVPDVGQLIGNKIQAQRDAGSGRGRDGFGNDGISGLKALGVRDLTYRLVFLGSNVRQYKQKDALSALHDTDENENEDAETRFLKVYTEEDLKEVMAMQEDRRIYQKLATSICPHIYGHEDIKKGVLLQILGGVHKRTPEGIRLRGDINVCIVGDPSTAKSQFLKYVTGFMPRAIYTSGKASSAAGLTASVVKDDETGEFTIEAGALMLADNGICCIDEFDKMDLTDQVAIHEAMEQQTISITKAGIQATLNARTSILAAANPIHGRYDKKLSLKQNIAMSPPIMSRFDLFFIIVDECHEQTDLCIAQHIINFHRFLEAGVEPDFTTKQLQLYITYARGLKPKLTEEAREYLVVQYRNLRQADATGIGKSSYRITVRQLESMIRLSEALAKIYGSKDILVRHVVEAAHLLKCSIVHVEQESVPLEDEDETDIRGAAEIGDSDAAFVADSAVDATQSQDTHMLDEGDAPKRTTITLSGEEYQKIVRSLMLQMKRSERETEEAGMTRSQIMNWYLDGLEEANMLETEEQLYHHRKIIKSVITRLVKTEHALLEMKDITRLSGDDDDRTGTLIDIEASGTSTANDNPVLVISPGYFMDDE